MHWITHIAGGPKRVNHAAVAVGHKIYSFGGYCTGENSREYTSMDVHVLNTTTFRWIKHPVSDLPYFENDDILPYKRYGHTAVVYNNKIYIWGGRNDHASCAVLFCFDTLWHCWTAPRVFGDIPLARDGHSACIWKNYMFIMGGYEEESHAFASTVYSLNFHTMRWAYVYTSGPTPPVRDFHTATCIDDKMYIFGGRGTEPSRIYSPDDETYSNELWYLDLNTNIWHKPQTTGDIPCGRRSHSAFVYKKKIYIFGGYNSVTEQHFSDMFEFDPQTLHWRLVVPLGSGPCDRRRQACVTVGDRVFLFGGTSPSSFFDFATNCSEQLVDHNDMYVLDFMPTLKTLSIIEVRKNALDFSELPSKLRLDVLNMFTPNKITLKRPNNSTG